MTIKQSLRKRLGEAGGSFPILLWLNWRCRKSGVSIRRAGNTVEFRKDHQAVRVAPKHAFFAPLLCASLDAFVHGLPSTQENGLQITDFSGQLDRFNFCRHCLAFGAVLEDRAGELRLRQQDRVMVLSRPHVVYAPFLAQHFDMYFSPLVPELRDGLQVLDFSQPGRLQTYRSSGLQFELASFPEEEEAMEQYFKWYRPKEGDLVFDVGAHCGVSAHLFAHLVGATGRVVCFEPDPVNFRLLQRNLERHALSNVTALNIAIAGSRGQVQFSSEGSVGSMMASLLTRESAGAMVAVDAWTLADAFQEFGVPHLCKIDIEGAEIEVIRDSSAVLTQHKPHLVLDTSHLKADGTPTASDIEAMLRHYGYEVISIPDPALTTWARAPHPQPAPQ